MGKEIKSGKKVESRIAASLDKRFAAKVRRLKTSKAQVIRDCIQSWVRG
jgi:hypothetical protein